MARAVCGRVSGGMHTYVHKSVHRYIGTYIHANIHTYIQAPSLNRRVVLAAVPCGGPCSRLGLRERPRRYVHTYMHAYIHSSIWFCLCGLGGRLAGGRVGRGVCGDSPPPPPQAPCKNTCCFGCLLVGALCIGKD